MRRAVLAVIMLVSAQVSAEPAVETFVDGLEYPWSLAFLPDGSMLVTERAGRLRLIRDGQLLPDPVAGVPDVHVAHQAGLFDVILDPEFADNRLVYLCYAHGTAARNATRVMRAEFEGEALVNGQVIFTATPWKQGSNHFGGRMAFLPDRTLLITTGEGFDFRESAQKLDSHLGKVIRIRTDGSVPPDNPFAESGDALPEIYTWGHRNPQGLVVLPGSGVVYLHEHGPRGGDELNRLEAGKNYGWPVITLGRDYAGATISPYTEYPQMEQPLVDWTPSIAPAGMTWYDGALFPQWRGDLFVAALKERSVRRIDLENDAIVGEEVLFTELGERMRDVRTGPDGALYLLTDSPDGRILRVVPDDEDPD